MVEGKNKMVIDDDTLARLSLLDLYQYAGDLILGENRKLYDELLELPVEVRVTAQRGICEGIFYEICLNAQGKYRRFGDLKKRIVQRSNLLSVLFNGIYIGEPKDLLNLRRGNQARILHPMEGLGQKIADLKFLKDSTSIKE